MTTKQTVDLDGLRSGYADCLRVIQNAEPGRPFVVAQLGQSLDGRIALPSGESRWINNSAALDHLHRLRAVVDAVIVGIGTALEDDPMLNVRRVSGPNPARVVIDPRGRLKAGAKLLAEDGAQRVVVTRPGVAQIDGVTQVVIEDRAGGFSPHDIVAVLSAHGFRRLLVEGGAQTVSSFIDAGALDRLHLLVATCLLGSGKTGINLAPLRVLADARRPRAQVHILDDGDVLFDCDMRS